MTVRAQNVFMGLVVAFMVACFIATVQACVTSNHYRRLTANKAKECDVLARVYHRPAQTDACLREEEQLIEEWEENS